MLGNSNLYFVDSYLPSCLERVMPTCIGTMLHRPSTAALVRAELQKEGVEVYEVGWSRLKQHDNPWGLYEEQNLESVLRAAHIGTARISMVLALGQNDCFSTWTSQKVFTKDVAAAVGKLAGRINPYVEEVFVSDPFDQKTKDGASYFDVEYVEYVDRVEIVRRALQCHVRRDKKWTNFAFAPADNQWLPDHMHLRPRGRKAFAETIVAQIMGAL